MSHCAMIQGYLWKPLPTLSPQSRADLCQHFGKEEIESSCSHPFPHQLLFLHMFFMFSYEILSLTCVFIRAFFFYNIVKDSTKYFNFPSVWAAGEEKIMWTLRQSELNSNPSSHLGFLLCELTLVAPIPQKCTAQSKSQSQPEFRSQLPPFSCVISCSTSLGLTFPIYKMRVIRVPISLSNSCVEFIVFVQNYFSKELPFKWINE